MRLALLVQAATAALLLCGCFGDDQNGGAKAAGGTGESSSGSGTGSGSGSTGSAGAGSSTGGGSGNTGGAGAGSGAGGAGGSGGASAAACAEMQDDISIKLVAAQACIPGKDIPQCVNAVDGLCCPVIIGLSPDSPEVQAYLDALKNYKSEGCTPACPPDPCPAQPSAKCMAGDTGGQCVAVNP
jgi:hypothetical protein